MLMLSFLYKKVSWSADLADIFGCDYVIVKQADQSLSNVGDWTYFCSIVNLQLQCRITLLKQRMDFSSF